MEEKKKFIKSFFIKRGINASESDINRLSEMAFSSRLHIYSIMGYYQKYYNEGFCGSKVNDIPLLIETLSDNGLIKG